MRPATTAPIRSRWTLLAYGALALPWSLAGLPILTYLPAFYAQELQLSAALVGLVFLAARLWDGLFDLIVGWLSDRSMSRFGRRKPWVIIAAPFLMISTWFLCNPPPGAGSVYLGVWAALFYSAWTAMGIPYISWGAELATDYVERSRVTAFREVFSMIGNLFFASAPLLFLGSDASLRNAVFLIAATVMFLIPLTVMPLGLWVRDPASPQRVQKDMLKDLAVVAKNPVLVRFVFATLAMLMANGVSNSMAVFSLNVGLGLPNKLFTVIFVIYVVGLCSLPVTLYLAKRVEKHHLLAGALVVQAVAHTAFLWVPAGNLTAALMVYVLIGLASAAWFILPTSILADIIDHSEVTTGQRHSGTCVAIYNLAVKVGLALGVGVSFILLDLVGYVPAALEHSAADARNIRLLGYGLPALLMATTAVLLLEHPITRKVQQELRTRIDAADFESSSAIKSGQEWRANSALIS